MMFGGGRRKGKKPTFSRRGRERGLIVFSPRRQFPNSEEICSLFFSIALPSAFPGKTWVVVFAKCRLSFFSREVRLGSFSHFCILGSSRQLQQPNPNRPDPLGRVVKKKRVCYVDKSLGNCKKNRKMPGSSFPTKKLLPFLRNLLKNCLHG